MALVDIQAQRDAAAGALDCLQRGLIVADERASVIFSNQTADKILRQQDGLRLHADGLHAATARESADLRALIRYAATPGTDPAGIAVLSLSRPSLKPGLLVRISPLFVQATRAVPPLGRAAVFLHDPAAHATVDKSALTRLFGLTHAESDIVALLLNGSTLQETAASLGISMNTVRTHLKHVFLKTDTNRQTQLVSTLLASVIQTPDFS